MRLNKWDSFWFSKYPTFNLSLFRIGFGLVFLYRVYFRASDHLWGITTTNSYFINGFHLPYFSGIPEIPISAYAAMITLRFILGFFIVFGIFSRVSVGLGTLTLAYVFAQNAIFYQHHVYFLILTGALLSLSPCGEHLSIDVWIKKLFKRKRYSFTLVWPIRLIQLLISFIYFFTASAKLNADWLSGRVLELCLIRKMIRFEGIFELLNNVPPMVHALTIVTLEFFLAFAFWSKGLRKYAFIVGISMHLFMEMTMKIGTFSYQMIAAYIIFLPPFMDLNNLIKREVALTDANTKN